jgi:hypothetical protein
MQEGQLLMTQADRDRLVTLRKAKKKLIGQGEAAQELGVSVRQVRRLIRGLKERGDKVVMHGLRGLPSKRRMAEEVKQEAIDILRREEYEGFGPTLASEYLSKRHQMEASRETVRKWMIEAGLWQAGRRRVEPIHVWRPRRSRLGELVQWDTSEHAWLPVGPKRYLIAMIDDATSRVMARLVESDSTEANMTMLELWLRRYGRPVSVYTDKASLFRTTEKRQRDEPGVDKDAVEMPPTQIGRALQELNITWIGAHSPQAKGRIERFFRTAQDRLVKGMQAEKVKTLEQANAYLEQNFLVWWEQTRTVTPANRDDAHRPVEKQHDLGAILSHVETRQVKNDYTLEFERQRYAIRRADIGTGLRGAAVRVEKRRDGSIAISFRDRYLGYELCERSQPAAPARRDKPAGSRPGPNAGGKSGWMKGFLDKRGPSLKKAMAISNATS